MDLAIRDRTIWLDLRKWRPAVDIAGACLEEGANVVLVGAEGSGRQQSVARLRRQWGLKLRILPPTVDVGHRDAPASQTAVASWGGSPFGVAILVRDPQGSGKHPSRMDPTVRCALREMDEEGALLLIDPGVGGGEVGLDRWTGLVDAEIRRNVLLLPEGRREMAATPPHSRGHHQSTCDHDAIASVVTFLLSPASRMFDRRVVRVSPGGSLEF